MTTRVDIDEHASLLHRSSYYLTLGGKWYEHHALTEFFSVFNMIDITVNKSTQATLQFILNIFF